MLCDNNNNDQKDKKNVEIQIYNANYYIFAILRGLQNDNRQISFFLILDFKGGDYNDVCVCFFLLDFLFVSSINNVLFINISRGFR